jgi:hypothetical protein
MKVPKEKEEELRIGDLKSNEIYKYYFKGFYSDDEKHRLVVKLWSEVNYWSWTRSLYNGRFQGERFSDTYDADIWYEMTCRQSSRRDYRVAD